jgi:thiol:disulfide interchange protein
LAVLSLTVTLTAPDTRSHVNVTSEFAGTPDTSSSNPERATNREAGVNAHTAITPKSAAKQAHKKKSLLSFFMIGIVINLILLFVVGIWAYREWQRRS